MLCNLNVPLVEPEDIIPHLAKQKRHWKAGYSARELVLAWHNAPSGIPKSVRSVIESRPEFGSTELIDGFFEREVDLRTPGRNSQTDLMAVVAWGEKLGTIAVEGKVDEPFGELVLAWNDGSAGKERRLAGLCATLGIDPDRAQGLRYQLLHRAASAVYEAQRYRCHQAIMLVHSFSSAKKWFYDFADFSDSMGISVSAPNTISASKKCDGISLNLAWVSDECFDLRKAGA